MKNGIKLCLATALACIGLAFTGCKTVPSNDAMYTTSYAIGVAAGMITNETKIDDESRNAVCEIMSIVRSCTPATNETFEAKWMDIARAHVDTLVKEGKLDKVQGEIVLTAFRLACKGIDYVFEVRFPKAKQYKELVTSAIDGFCDGFLLVFKPVNDGECNDCCIDCGERGISFDVNAYRYLKGIRK